MPEQKLTIKTVSQSSGVRSNWSWKGNMETSGSFQMTCQIGSHPCGHHVQLSADGLIYSENGTDAFSSSRTNRVTWSVTDTVYTFMIQRRQEAETDWGVSALIKSYHRLCISGDRHDVTSLCEITLVVILHITQQNSNAPTVIWVNIQLLFCNQQMNSNQDEQPAIQTDTPALAAEKMIFVMGV